MKRSAHNKNLWYELKIIPPDGYAEAVAGYLFEAGAEAVEERTVDEKTVLVTHFPCDDIFNQRVAMLGGCLSEIARQPGAKKLLEIKIRKIEERPWALEARRSFKPVLVVPGVKVAPSWKSVRKRRGETLLCIDPGEAFGTGLHPTTKTCARLMVEAMRRFDSPKVLDVGTGTGILAMIAFLKGAGEVTATDNDPKALEVAAENFRRNRCLVNLTAAPIKKIKKKFHVVVANILLEELERLSEHLLRVTAPEGILIVGGLLADQGEQMRKQMRTLKMCEPWRQIRSGEWLTMGFIKP